MGKATSLTKRVGLLIARGLNIGTRINGGGTVGALSITTTLAAEKLATFIRERRRGGGYYRVLFSSPGTTMFCGYLLRNATVCENPRTTLNWLPVQDFVVVRRRSGIPLLIRGLLVQVQLGALNKALRDNELRKAFFLDFL